VGADDGVAGPPEGVDDEDEEAETGMAFGPGWGSP
jgi:hypothetical protein